VLSEEGIVESNGNSGKNGNSASIDIKKEAQSLRMEFKDIQDFYSSKEFATFDKKKSVKMKEKSKKRKLRKKSTDDDDEITSATIIDELEQKISEDHNNNQMDHGSRKTHQPSNITIENENKRRLGYEKAVSNLAEKSKSQQIFLKSTGILNDDGADEDDAEILSSLAKARRLALLNAKNEVKMEMNTNENDDDVGAKIALEYVNKFKEVKNHQNIFDTTTKKSHEEANDAILNKGEDELEFDEIDAEGRRANGTLVFTSTTEFSTRLQARLNEKARAKSEAIIKASINDVKPITNMNEEMNIDHMKVSNEENDENSVDRSEMDLDDLDQMKEFAEKHFTKEEIDEQLSFVHQQPLVAKGMAATLALLKDSGELKKTEELAGRAKDARSNDPSSEHYGIKLDYRDEHGRKLTQKEAFRQLCYRFHGYGPGKKNKEKRLKVRLFEHIVSDISGLTLNYFKFRRWSMLVNRLHRKT
jgi:U4/U6.U5 tri-snRNP-associated protein 1